MKATVECMSEEEWLTEKWTNFKARFVGTLAMVLTPEQIQTFEDASLTDVRAAVCHPMVPLLSPYAFHKTLEEREEIFKLLPDLGLPDFGKAYNTLPLTTATHTFNPSKHMFWEYVTFFLKHLRM